MTIASAASGFTTLLAPLLLCLSGCAAAPVQEMSDARQAIGAARAAGAEERAPEQLKAASDLLTAAEQALLGYRYREARMQAEKALREAQAALEAANVARQN